MSGDENAANTEKPLDIPKELWMMVDHLFRNAIKQVRKSDGNPAVMNQRTVYAYSVYVWQISYWQVHILKVNYVTPGRIPGFCVFLLRTNK